MRRLVGVVLVALALVAAAACEVPANDEPVELSGPFARLETTTTSTTGNPAGTTKDAVLFFLASRDGATVLEPVTRNVPIDAGIQEILRDLFTVPPRDDVAVEAALDTAIPSSAQLLSAQRSATVPERLVVDVRDLFGEQGVQGVRLRNALAQIVWTATVSGTGVSEVVFLSEGERQDALVDDLQSTTEPVRRSDYDERT